MTRKRAVHAQQSTSLVSAAAAMSFLKETRGMLTWTPKDMQKSLRISPAQIKEVIAALQLQGYIKQENANEWLTSLAGEAVSGSKPPRFARASVEKSISALKERIKAANKDPRAPYRVSKAVAFGDFLSDGAQAQAADVGIKLSNRADGKRSNLFLAADKRSFLKKLKARDAKLNLLPFETWMGERSHALLL